MAAVKEAEINDLSFVLDLINSFGDEFLKKVLSEKNKNKHVCICVYHCLYSINKIYRDEIVCKLRYNLGILIQ